MSKIRKIAPYFLLVFGISIFFLIGNVTINQHFHRLPSGTIERHAHPYTKNKTGTPFQNHHHSNIEYFILSQLSITIFLLTGLGILLSFFLPRNLEIKNFSSFSIISNTDLYFLLNYHAPPFSSN